MTADTNYIELMGILSKGKMLNFVLGMSLGGKTYQALLLAINTYKRKKARSVYLVRNENQVDNDLIEGLVAEIEKIVANHPKWQLPPLVVKGNDVNATFQFGDDKPFFSFKALSTVLRKKRVTIPNVAWIIFDEFVLNTRSGESYLTDEILKFKWFFSKTSRGYDYKTRALFLGNTESAYNPYFAEYGIKPNMLLPNVITFNKNNPWAVELWISEARRKEISEKGLDKILGGDYGRYAFGGAFLNDRTQLYFEKLPPKARPSVCFLARGGFFFTVWKCGEKLYVKKGKDCSVILSEDNMEAVDGVVFAGIPFFKQTIQSFKLKADLGLVMFSNPEAETYFFNIYNSFY